jgi:hypothetical protein
VGDRAAERGEAEPAEEQRELTKSAETLLLRSVERHDLLSPVYRDIPVPYPSSPEWVSWPSMNAQVLIDGVVRHTTILIAQLATSGGVRAPLAHIAN